MLSLFWSLEGVLNQFENMLFHCISHFAGVCYGKLRLHHFQYIMTTATKLKLVNSLITAVIYYSDAIFAAFGANVEADRIEKLKLVCKFSDEL